MILLNNKLVKEVDTPSNKKLLYTTFNEKYIFPYNRNNPGDIVLFDNSTNSKVIVSPNDYSTTTYPVSNYIPIGIVVVPNYHNRYGDRTGSMVSLLYSSLRTPDSGSTSTNSIYFGGGNTDIPLTSYTKYGYIGSGGNVTNEFSGVTSVAYFASDRFTTVKNPYDTKVGYSNAGSSYRYIPSPYVNNEMRNPLYCYGKELGNAIADIDGKANTEVCLQYATSQPNWKTDSEIDNEYGEGYYPAVCSCWRYHTVGTNQGDWYLPSIGELGYLLARLNVINNSINKLTGTSDKIQVYTNGFFLSSTKADTDKIHYVITSIGSISTNTNRQNVRAFCRI